MASAYNWASRSKQYRGFPQQLQGADPLKVFGSRGVVNLTMSRRGPRGTDQSMMVEMSPEEARKLAADLLAYAPKVEAWIAEGKAERERQAKAQAEAEAVEAERLAKLPKMTDEELRSEVDRILAERGQK